MTTKRSKFKVSSELRDYPPLKNHFLKFSKIRAVCGYVNVFFTPFICSINSGNMLDPSNAKTSMVRDQDGCTATRIRFQLDVCSGFWNLAVWKMSLMPLPVVGVTLKNCLEWLFSARLVLCVWGVTFSDLWTKGITRWGTLEDAIPARMEKDYSRTNQRGLRLTLTNKKNPFPGWIPLMNIEICFPWIERNSSQEDWGPVSRTKRTLFQEEDHPVPGRTWIQFPERERTPFGDGWRASRKDSSLFQAEDDPVPGWRGRYFR